MNGGIKLTRTQLKSVVKECLVEILQEGLGAFGPIKPMPPTSEYSSLYENKQRVRASNEGRELFRPKNSALDTPIKSKNEVYSNKIVETIRQEARGNPIMADILADTAMTTLPKMLSNGDSSGRQTSKSLQVEHFNGTPEEVFGEEIASKWANLAFMDASPGKIS